MSTAYRVLKKLLPSGTHIEDGFEYQFISVNEDDKGGLELVVNVLLPNKGQSYVVEKFSYDIESIIDKFSKLIGDTIQYKEIILVNGKSPNRDGLFISPEDSEEIIRALNENVKNVVVSNDKNLSYVRANISFSPQKRGRFYMMDSHKYIDFYLSYEIRKMTYNEEEVKLNFKMLDDFAEVFNDKLVYSDLFRDKLQEIMYNVLEPSIKIKDLDVYINAQYWINKVEGIEVTSHGDSKQQDFSDEMFSPTF
jgi:hypothetical protein